MLSGHGQSWQDTPLNAYPRVLPGNTAPANPARKEYRVMVIYTDRDGVTHIRTASGAHYVVRNGKYSRVAW